MNNESNQQKVLRLKESYQAGDRDKVDDLLAEIVKTKNQEAVALLLTMKPYKEVDDLDEMWQIIHVVESFPEDVYLDGLISIIGKICLSSPMFTEHLVGRITGRADSTKSLIARIGRLSPEDLPRIYGLVRKICRESIRANPNCEQLLANLALQMDAST